MYNFFGMYKNILNNLTSIIIILMGLICLIIDGTELKDKGSTKELGIVKAISYTYIAIGIAMFIFVQII